MKRLVILSAGTDICGVGYALKRAFDRYAPGWEARAICRRPSPYGYPTDLLWPRRTESREARRLLAAADVVHVTDNVAALALLPAGKRVVVQHLGSRYRADPAGVGAVCRAHGALQVTDSIDLVGPEVDFLPTAADLERLAALRVHPEPGRVRIAHAPTNRAIKSTDEVIGAVEMVARRQPVDFDLIEGVPNEECLARKARADIFVDQLGVGFGVNAIECWAMGIPVVSGLADPLAYARAEVLFGRLPWLNATAESLPEQLERLVVDAGLRADLGAYGRDHVGRWHAERAVVERTLAVYGRLA